MDAKSRRGSLELPVQVNDDLLLEQSGGLAPTCVKQQEADVFNIR